MANKKTLKDFYNEIIEVVKNAGRDDLAEFCEDRIEKLNRKSGSSDKPTKTQIENEGVKDTILEVLEELGSASATKIATDPRLGVSGQKVTSLLSQLIKAGKVVRTEEKGKVSFSLTPTEEVAEN